MSKYDYLSEKEALKKDMWPRLVKYDRDILEFYLANGFDALAKALKLADGQRRIVFDFLMLEKKAILECIKRNKIFFLKIISQGQGELIRPMMGLKASQYDQVWLEALDLLNLYFVERKVDEKLFNLSMERFFQSSILNEQNRKKHLW